MRTSTSILAILMASLSHFAHPSLANWTPVKGAQINFYTNTQCTAYNGEVAAWWDRAPRVGIYLRAGHDPDCITLNMPGNSLSINTAHLWPYTTTGTEPAATFGYCQLYDGFDCTGNMATSYYDNVSGGGTCQPSRSVDGWLWKSAKCEVFN
jgi:hypothetical protein